MTISHLRELESESIFIIREIAAEVDKPVLLYSIGKDSAVLLHLARKAFYPSPLPFPLLHVDTTWKFKAMYELRDKVSKTAGLQLIVHRNADAIEKGINPFDHETIHTDMWKTEGLKQALDKFHFDAAFGGARRDEEKSRAKERIVSLRSESHYWDPKSQRPELWSLFNTKKATSESLRVFPLSNWTELDVWRYIQQEQIDIVPLYFAEPRQVVQRDGMLIMVDDDRFVFRDNELPVVKNVRFRTLGCYPLTAAFESEADTIEKIIEETANSKNSERQGRVIDRESSSSMEKKKQHGYF